MVKKCTFHQKKNIIKTKEKETLDKEKILKIAKIKFKEIKEKEDHLVELEKEKGNSILEKSATEVREHAIAVT